MAARYPPPYGGYGWGVGPWGLGTWGTARSSSTISIEPRIWSLDHFGILLLAAYNGGSIYDFGTQMPVVVFGSVESKKLPWVPAWRHS